jgi:hypothetical protein
MGDQRDGHPPSFVPHVPCRGCVTRSRADRTPETSARCGYPPCVALRPPWSPSTPLCEAEFDRAGDGGRPRVGIELGDDAAEVVARRLRADEEVLGDIAAGAPTREIARAVVRCPGLVLSAPPNNAGPRARCMKPRRSMARLPLSEVDSKSMNPKECRNLS